MDARFDAVPSEYFHTHTTYTLYVALKDSFVAKFLSIITIYFYRLREEQHKKNHSYTVVTGNINDFIFMAYRTLNQKNNVRTRIFSKISHRSGGGNLYSNCGIGFARHWVPAIRKAMA